MTQDMDSRGHQKPTHRMLNPEDMTPEERLKRFHQITAKGLLRLAEERLPELLRDQSLPTAEGD